MCWRNWQAPKNNGLSGEGTDVSLGLGAPASLPAFSARVAPRAGRDAGAPRQRAYVSAVPLKGPVSRWLLIFGLVLFVLSVSSFGTEFYVAPTGNDSNPGTKSRPFATLERARDAARAAQRSSRPLTITLRGGDYVRTNSLQLASEDSGSANAPVTWRAFGREKVRLLGGRTLKNLGPVRDPAVMSRLEPAAREHVVGIDLKALGITDFGQMKSRGFARPVTPAHCELFFGGKPMVLARWPNEGTWEQIAGFPQEAAANDGHGGDIGKLPDGFLYQGDRPRRWGSWSNVWVHGYWAWDWANSYERVDSIDLDRRWIKTAPPHGNYGFRKGQRFYFLNILEELDQPGEWFLDTASGVLYFWPPHPIGVTDETVLSLLREPFIQLKDVSHVIFRGIGFEANRGTAVEVYGGASNRIDSCDMRNIGSYAVIIEGGQGHGVVGCEICDTGDGGVKLTGGDRQTLKAAGHFVESCRFARQGRWSKCYVPALLMDGVGLRASHNLITEHPHCAIAFTGNDHLIEFNEISRIALETGDVGAIYSGRNYTYRGNRIRHNYIHETGGVGMGSMGIYMDDCVSGTEIVGNLFYKVQRAVFLGGGRDHQVINNVFVDCNHAVELDGRGLDKSPVWHEMVDKTMRESLRSIPSELYRRRYPALATLDQYYGKPGAQPIEGEAFKGIPPENNVVARNVCVGKWLNTYWHANPQMLQLSNNLTNAERHFNLGSNPRAIEFRLKKDSPAWALGFEKIPVERIGPQMRD